MGRCRRRLQSQLLLVAAFTMVVAMGKKAKTPIFGKVFTLTGEPYVEDDDAINFDEVIGARPLVVVNFMVDCAQGAEAGLEASVVQQCQLCRKLKPSFKRLAKSNVAITFAQVDMEAEEGLAQRFGVTAAPTLVLLLNGTSLATLSGDVTEDASQWIASSSRVSHVKTEYDLGKLVRARSKGDVLVVARGTAQVGHLLAETNAQIYMEDKSLHMRYAFLHTGEETFSFEVHRGINEKSQFEVTPGKEMFAEDFVAFVRRERVPTFGLLSADNVQSLVNSAQGGFVMVCLEETLLPKEAENYAPLFKKLAKKFRKYKFFYGDTRSGELGQHAPLCEDFPSMVYRKGDRTVARVLAPGAPEEAEVVRFLKDAGAQRSPGDVGRGEL